MAAGPIAERNQDATIYVGGLDEKVSDTLMWELFVQAGPVVNVHMPKDRVTQSHQGYGFVEFLAEDDADYAIKIMNMIKLYGKPIRVNKASAHQKNLDVGANVFIGNLDSEVDEKLLYDTFSAFGVILQTPKIMRDPDTGNSKGFAFINYASFEASDAAIEAMNGQHLCNRAVSISYAFKKDVKGERHGSAAERLLAAQNPLSQADRPHQLFADAPPTQIPMMHQMPVPPPPIMQPTMQVPMTMMTPHQMAPPPRIMPWQNQQAPPPQPPTYQPPPPPPPSFNSFAPPGFHGGFVPPPPPPPSQQGQMPPPLPPSHPALPSHMQNHMMPPPPPPMSMGSGPPPPMSMGSGPPPMPPPPPMQPNNMMPMNWKPSIPPPPPPAPA